MDPQAINARKRARRLAMQALYQWQLSGDEAVDIEKQFRQQDEFKNADAEYFHELLFNIERNSVELGELVDSILDRPFDEVDPVERAIILIALYELKNRLDIPYRAVLNEAINLAKKFGAADAHKYINGILDKYARTARQHEVQGS